MFGGWERVRPLRYGHRDRAGLRTGLHSHQAEKVRLMKTMLIQEQRMLNRTTD